MIYELTDDMMKAITIDTISGHPWESFLRKCAADLVHIGRSDALAIIDRLAVVLVDGPRDEDRHDLSCEIVADIHDAICHPDAGGDAPHLRAILRVVAGNIRDDLSIALCDAQDSPGDHWPHDLHELRAALEDCDRAQHRASQIITDMLSSTDINRLPMPWYHDESEPDHRPGAISCDDDDVLIDCDLLPLDERPSIERYAIISRDLTRIAIDFGCNAPRWWAGLGSLVESGRAHPILASLYSGADAIHAARLECEAAIAQASSIAGWIGCDHNASAPHPLIVEDNQ